MLGAVAATSLFLGTADLMLLATGAIASQLPDLDTSKSWSGRILFPIAQWLEKRYPHRTITHSFLATGAIAAVFSPVALLNFGVWLALVLGYFCGWFADVFTKSGVAALYPGTGRLVIPANPRLRLSTGSNAEYVVMTVLVLVTIASININISGGILRTFNQTLGLPSGAVEIASSEGPNYLLFATISGRTAVTSLPIQEEFEVIRPLTQNDLLVKDREGRVYRAGRSQECQIIANRITIRRSSPIRTRVQEIQLDDQLLSDVIAKLPPELRTYINGTLTLEDASDLLVPTYGDRFNTLTLQPGQGIMIVRLESASPVEVSKLIGDYYASGYLTFRIVEVL